MEIIDNRVDAGKDRLSEKSLHEINQYNDTAFPIGMYIVTKDGISPKGRGYLDLHWHEEIQITLVTDGVLVMQVNGEEYTLKAGEAIFINRNLLHVSANLTDDGRYVSFNFPDKMLGFFPGSRMEQDDVLPYTGNYAFPATVFTRDTDWQKKILDELYDMQNLFLEKKNEPSQKTEYMLSLKITYIWYLLITNAGEEVKLPSKGYIRKQERMQKMLTYIHDNYMRGIRLADIAKAASVSEGECCRCFKEMIHKTPNQYLLDYRIGRSMEFLNYTEWTITEVALHSGFNDSSYFTQYFKKYTGMTPKEYRYQKC